MGVIGGTARRYFEHGLFDWAAALTYYAVLSLFPALLVLVALLGVFGQYPQTTNLLLEIVRPLAPPSVLDVFRRAIESVVLRPRGAHDALLVAGVIGALNLEGIDYNVFITRELNPRIQEDAAYFSDEAPPGEALYGVFIQACNGSGDARAPANRFILRDNQNNMFEPKPLPADNQFAYHPRELGPDECIPEIGSVAQLGPTAGAMLLFQLPLAVTENRPLELEIAGQDGDKLTYELDI